MPRLTPFRGVRYAPGAGDPTDLVCPPYDVISPSEEDALRARSPHNAVRLELPHQEGADIDRYATAGRLLTTWHADGVLHRDDEPAFYGYRMTADRGVTTGVLGALELEEPGAGILPHERTTPKAKSDRLDLLRATRCNLSPIWGLSMSGSLAAAWKPDGRPATAATDADGVLHELWPITDEAVVAAITAAVAEAPVIVADGHHRFEVARAYQQETVDRDDGGDESAGPDAILTLVVELSDDQLMVEPIHRLLTQVPEDLVDRLGRWFTVTPDPADGADGLRLVTTDGRWLLVPSGELDDLAATGLDSSRLDVALDGMGVEVSYQHGEDRVAEAISSGRAEAGVLLRPATVAQISDTGRRKERMPPKTTFFWPKPLTGMVFRTLD
ncbi:MAG TPA: DUF1015 domain-containing protein [Acidimicrobiales bacterium]|nr:DUF1015 domain-containing protein [Acidimicrobiales bacterium]